MRQTCACIYIYIYIYTYTYNYMCTCVCNRYVYTCAYHFFPAISGPILRPPLLVQATIHTTSRVFLWIQKKGTKAAKKTLEKRGRGFQTWWGLTMDKKGRSYSRWITVISLLHNCSIMMYNNRIQNMGNLLYDCSIMILYNLENLLHTMTLVQWWYYPIWMILRSILV